MKKIIFTQCFVWGSLLLAGCTSSVVPEPVAVSELKVIETVQLSDQSTTEPVDVNEATAQVIHDLEDSNEPLTSISLTLEQVRASALANNLDLQVNLVDPAMAQKSLDVERAKFESVFSLSAASDYVEAVGTGAVSKAWSSNVGVGKPLPTGGALSMSLPMNDSDPGGLASASANVTVIQSLLRGAGTAINTQSIRIAAYQWQMASARTKLYAIAWLADADKAYWRLYLAHKELAIRREQYKLAQDQLIHAQKKVAAGDAARIEIVRAEAGLASRLESVINAETTVDYYARHLRGIMNRPDLPVDSSVTMILETEPHSLGLTLD